MTEDDFLVYEDQKGRRKAGCLPLKEPLSFRGRINKKCGDQLPGPSRSWEMQVVLEIQSSWMINHFFWTVKIVVLSIQGLFL